MKLKPIKILGLIIRPKTFLGILAMLFILGLGIGAYTASSGDSLFPVLLCSGISLAILVYIILNRTN